MYKGDNKLDYVIENEGQFIDWSSGIVIGWRWDVEDEGWGYKGGWGCESYIGDDKGDKQWDGWEAVHVRVVQWRWLLKIFLYFYHLLMIIN